VAIFLAGPVQAVTQPFTKLRVHFPADPDLPDSLEVTLLGRSSREFSGYFLSNHVVAAGEIIAGTSLNSLLAVYRLSYIGFGENVAGKMP
jgi:hypothetical protein